MSRFPITGGVVIVIAGAAAAVVLAVQREETGALRSEIELRREQSAEVTRLQNENRRLRAGVASSTELAELRATSTEVQRLRAEIEKLKAPRR